MTWIKKFDSDYCKSIECDKLWIHNKIAVCYGLPESCTINIKHGYPKEVKKPVVK